MITKKTTINSLLIGSVIGIGIYHFTKKNKEKMEAVSHIVEDYNLHHNNSKIDLDSIESIDSSKRTYYVLTKTDIK